MWIKICGVTSVEDAEMISAAGADAIGLNFYSRSKRFVGGLNATETATHARAIRSVVADRLDVVGVFVNASASDVANITAEAGLTAVQFHGDEPVDLIADFHQLSPTTPIIRAFRVGPSGTKHVDRQLRQLESANIPVAAVLIDAFVKGEYGGTGQTVHCDIIQRWQAGYGQNRQLILAGGLTPDNVATAVQNTNPWGIDTASGVESAPGIKCPDKVRHFVTSIRSIASPGSVPTSKRDRIIPHDL